MKAKLQTTRHSDGRIFQEQWMVELTIHRDNGPAFIIYGPDEEITYQSWIFYGEVHRLDGPARIWYEDGKISKVGWYVNGKAMHLAQWGRFTDLEYDELVELKLIYG